jgi:hypothetical protein
MGVHSSANDGACFVEVHGPDGVVVGMPGPALLTMAEQAVAAGGGGTTASQGSWLQQPPPLLSCVVRSGEMAMTPEDFDRFFAQNQGAGSPGGGRDQPSLESLKFDTTGFQYRGQKIPGRDHLWSTPEGDMVALIYSPGHPGLPENAQSVEELRAGCAAKFKMPGGQIVELRVRQTKARPGMQVIFKTPRGSGWTYVGSLCIPFRDFGFVIQGMCEERGTTGVREAMVMYLQDTNSDATKIPAGDLECPPWDSDNQRFDSLFPSHPLSRLRQILNRVSDSVEIDACTAEQPGFRLPQSSV